MKPLFAIFVLIAGFILVPPAYAGDLIISRAVLEDVAGTLTIADVAGRVTTPLESSLSLPSTNSVHWLCLRVRAPSDGSKVVLFIRPSFLNEVRLYEAGADDPLTWKTRVVGNHYTYAKRDRARSSLGFVVNVAAPEATYYIRLKTRSASQLNVEALKPDEAERKDHQRDLVMVFFVTSMLSLLLWAILSYLLDRQKVVGLFAFHQGAYMLFGMAATGYLAPLAPASFPQLEDWVTLLLYFAINFTTLLFTRELFKPYNPPRVLMRGLNLFLWIFPFLLAAIAMGYNAFAINANAALFRITWLYFVFMAFGLRAESTPSRRTLRIFFVAVLMSNAVFWYAGRSSRIASKINLSGVQLLIVDGLIIGGLFAIILHTRARQAQQEAQQAAVDLLLVQQKFEIEKDLKNQAEAQAHTDYLTGLSNRRHFVALAECELARSTRFRRPFTLLMIDIDHFKAVNDTLGHDIGDAVLQKVSHLIRDAMRDEDIFGRTGGEEFAAVLVETDGNDAMQVARRLCTSVAEAMIVPPGAGRVKVTISVGLTELKGRSINFDLMFKEADWAMYNAKQAGRNRVVINESGVLNDQA